MAQQNEEKQQQRDQRQAERLLPACVHGMPFNDPAAGPATAPFCFKRPWLGEPTNMDVGDLGMRIVRDFRGNTGW